MPTVHLSPIFNDAQFDSNGAFLVGGKLYWYLAGTSTPATVYTDNTGTTAHANPIILTGRGEPVAPIWLADGVSYKAILKTSTDVPVGIPWDNITGINVATTTLLEWVPISGTLTYIGPTSFGIAGDQTSLLLQSRRIKATVTAGTVYGAIISSAFGTSTTVTLSLDSGALDGGLSAVSYGVLSPTHSSIPKTYTDGWGGTAGGTADALTISVVPAIGVYAAGQTFKFIPAFTNATTAPTLNVNGLGAKTIKGRGAAGPAAITAGTLVAGQEMSAVYDGTQFILEVGGGSGGSQVFTADGTFTVPTCNYVMVDAIGGGGGGGSGSCSLGGSDRNGGGAGGSGARIQRVFRVSEIGGIGAGIAVTVATSVAGGVGVSADSDGNAGTAGGLSSFGNYLKAYGGAQGLGGTRSAISAGTGGGGGGSGSAGSGATGGGPKTGSGVSVGYGGGDGGAAGAATGSYSEWGGAGGGAGTETATTAAPWSR